MRRPRAGVLGRIGDTSLLPLRTIGAGDGARILLKRARLRVVPSDGGRMTERLTRDMVEAARVIAARTGGVWTDQLNNTDQLVAYHDMAEQIWTQTGGRIDGFVQSVGTAASLRGVGETLRRHDDRIQIVAVEPAESPVLSGGATGSHTIDGVGAGFVVPLWQAGIADRIERVSTDDAVAMVNSRACRWRCPTRLSGSG